MCLCESFKTFPLRKNTSCVDNLIKAYTAEDWTGTVGHVVVWCASVLLLSLSSGCVISRVCMWAFSFLRVIHCVSVLLNAVWVSCLCCRVRLNFPSSSSSSLFFFFYFLLCVFVLLPPPTGLSALANGSSHSNFKKKKKENKTFFSPLRYVHVFTHWFELFPTLSDASFHIPSMLVGTIQSRGEGAHSHVHMPLFFYVKSIGQNW